MKSFRSGCKLGLAAVLLTMAVANPASAGEVRFMRTDSREAFAQGTADSVAVGEFGELTVGSSVDEIAAIDQPYVYQVAELGRGWVVGTGGDGMVLTVASDGTIEPLPRLTEEHVFAVGVGPSGDIWAGTSPSGLLYRWDGEAWISYAIHQQDDLYIWALEPFAGGVYVGTGASGRVLRVSTDGVVEDLTGELDTHVRSLLLLEDGTVLAGTEGIGKIVRVANDATRVLHVSASPEITALATDAAGTCYAAAVKSPATWLAGAVQQAASADASGSGTATITVTSTGNGSDASADSELLRFACTGGVVESLGKLEGETAYDLAVYDHDLWVASGQEGKVYRVDSNGTRFLTLDLDESQVIGLVSAADQLAIATSNAGRLLTTGERPAERGTFESAVFDAGQLSRIGALSWDGEGEIRFAVRSGQTGTPDDGWGGWSPWRSGYSVDFDELDDGRYLQWRAELPHGARLNAVELAFQQHNVAPRVTELEVLAPGEVLVDASFNPGQQVFEPARPASDGIFSTLQPSVTKDAEHTKKLWKAGARTLRWKAEDGNQDQLRYKVEVRPEGGDWMPVAEDQEAAYLTVDVTVLPDGAYRFRVTADDRQSNSPDEAFEHTVIGPLVILDQTPPVLGSVSDRDGRIELEVRDGVSTLRSIEVSRDGGDWRPAQVVDGSVDEKSETVVVEREDGTGFVILRATDRAHNHAVFTVP